MSAEMEAKRRGTNVQFMTRREIGIYKRTLFLHMPISPHRRARRVFDNREFATARFRAQERGPIKLRYPFVQTGLYLNDPR